MFLDEDLMLHLSRGEQYLGGFIGREREKLEWVSEKVKIWERECPEVSADSICWAHHESTAQMAVYGKNRSKHRTSPRPNGTVGHSATLPSKAFGRRRDIGRDKSTSSRRGEEAGLDSKSG